MTSKVASQKQLIREISDIPNGEVNEYLIRLKARELKFNIKFVPVPIDLTTFYQLPKKYLSSKKER